MQLKNLPIGLALLLFAAYFTSACNSGSAYTDGYRDGSSSRVNAVPAPQQNQQYYQPPYQQPVYQQPQQYYQQPAPYYSPYQNVAPGSRFYSNPYAIPPAQYSSPQYDSDQYYVPPTSYENIERQQVPFKPNSVAGEF